MSIDGIIQAILIDDDVAYSEELKGIAADYHIQISHYTNLQTAKEEMLDGKAVDFIILDAHCFIDEDATASDFDFLAYALLALNEMEKEKGKYIPFCINTGYLKNEKVYRHLDRTKIFEKSIDQEKLLNHISSVVQNDFEYQTIKNNPEVFEIFAKKLLPAEYRQELIEVFREIERKNPKEFKTTLRRMRPFLEAAYKELRKCKGLLSDALFPGEEPNVSGVSRFLAGDHYYDKSSKQLKFPGGGAHANAHFLYCRYIEERDK